MKLALTVRLLLRRGITQGAQAGRSLPQFRHVHTGRSRNSPALAEVAPKKESAASRNSTALRGRLEAEIFESGTLDKVISQNPIIFRDACECDQCIDQSTHQREFSVVEIPSTIHPGSITVTDETVTVDWHDDIPRFQPHVSVLSKARILDILTMKPFQLSQSQPYQPWNNHIFSQSSRAFTYDQLLNNELALVAALIELSRVGLVFVKGCPHDENVVRTLANKIGILRNTFYGETWDVRSVPDAKNVAYTSKFLDFHMDLLYMIEPPGLQLLHCLHNSCTGGESLFVDSFHIVSTLRERRPDHLSVLTDTMIRYKYNNAGYFFTDVKPVVQSPEPHNLHFRPQRDLPEISPRDHHVDQINWSPPFMDSFSHREKDLGVAGQQDMLQAMKAFDLLLHDRANLFQDKLEEGTCAIFDNLRVLHARNAFDVNSGKRWLKGAYADRQDFYSKLINRPA